MRRNGKSQVFDDGIPKQAEESWDRLAAWYSARKRNSYEFKIQLPTILNLLGRLHKKDLLDIGCGPAVYLAEFARSGANTLGVDLSRRMLDAARENAKMANVKLALQRVDMHSLPYIDNSFDVVTLILTILNVKILEKRQEC